MKNIENYTCTLEQAKQLKELGIEQDSLMWYAIAHDDIAYLGGYENTFVAYEDGKNELLPDHLRASYLRNENTPLEIHILHDSDINWLDDELSIYCEKLYSAFTSQELGELIVDYFSNKGIPVYQSMNKCVDFIMKQNKVDNCFIPRETMDKEAQARASFLIHLLENKK